MENYYGGICFKDGRKRDCLYAPLVEQCKKDGAFRGVENLPKWPNDYPYFYIWIADDHRDVVDKLGSKHAVAVWNFGYANLMESDHAQRLLTVGSRIKGTHVYNNNATDDQHLLPVIVPEAVGGRSIN